MLQLFYVGENVHQLSSRVGSFVYVPAGGSGTLRIRTSEPWAYRVCYVGGVTGEIKAVSNLCQVLETPVRPSNSTKSIHDINVVLHPQYVLARPAAARIFPYVRVHIPFFCDSMRWPLSCPTLPAHRFAMLSYDSVAFRQPVPPYFSFNFALNPSAVTLALQLDEKLRKIKADLVPAEMTEHEFWENYFFRMVLLGAAHGHTLSPRHAKQ